MFSPEEVRKIAKLSALELSDAEVQEFATQFSEILEHFEQLKQAHTASAPAPDESLLRIGRPDAAVVSKVSPEQFSPYMEGRFFKVPKVIDQG
jgi:aspartyl-tRNA(Asn)/glutamyl-tRNA(Gln) amidotransferase subunit C